MTRPPPIGTTPGRVTAIVVKSTELPPGQVRRKKPTQRRPRRWLWTRNTKIHTENLDWSQDATKE